MCVGEGFHPFQFIKAAVLSSPYFGFPWRPEKSPNKSINHSSGQLIVSRFFPALTHRSFLMVKGFVLKPSFVFTNTRVHMMKFVSH